MASPMLSRPDSASSKDREKHSSARKLWRRLCFDEQLDKEEFTVGLIETKEQAVRKSGAEAWSMRLHSTVVELSFADCAAKYESGGGEVPFHRIMWFKQNGAVVWEADSNPRTKACGEPGHPYCSNNHHHHHHGSGSTCVTPLSSSFTGCSPPAGSFMARLAGASAGPSGSSSSSFTAGLPPRAGSAQPWDANNAAAATAAAAGSARPQRPSGTDTAGSSPGSSSWGGPVHWSAAAAAAAAGGAGSTGGSHHCVGSYLSSAGQSPLLGSSPIGAAALFGTSPRLAGSCGSGCYGEAPGSAGCCSGLLGTSPYGSCSNSWSGPSPLAAAAAAAAVGTSPVLLRPGLQGGRQQHQGWVGGRVELAEPGQEQLSQQQLVQQQGQEAAPGEEPGEPPVLELVDYSALPDECWVNVLQRLGVRELCYVARASRALRGLASRSFLWSCAYDRLFGAPPPPDWSFPTLKRMCRRSELKASRWLEAEVEARAAGLPGTACCQLDDCKVLSGDGCAVRLWALDTGRRIATLRGHTGRVTSVAFDDELVLSGCSQGTVKLWAMDELKAAKTLRHHSEPVTSVLLYGAMPISAGEDGCVALWDAAAPNQPLVVLEADGPVHCLQVHEERGQLISGGSSLAVWDLATAQLLCTLAAPPGGLASSPSSTSLHAAAGGGSSLHGAAGGAAAVAAASGTDGSDADADEGVLLHDGWLLDEEQEEAEAAAAAAAAGAGAGGGAAAVGQHGDDGRGRPFNSVSSDTNLLAAGRAGAVVLWDLRAQDPVGLIRAAAAPGSAAAWAPNAPCVGVQLDSWKLVTGFAAAADGGGSSGGAWWRSSSSSGGGGAGGGASAASAGGGGWSHSIDVYDIRSAASFSSCSGGGGGAARGGLWAAAPVMSLPVANRVTCFQFHGQSLLVGQEGAACCLMTFNPPGTSSSRAAAAWGFGRGGGSLSGSGPAAAVAGGLYGASPGAAGGCGSYGAAGAGGDEFGGGGGGGGKQQKKKGAAKVPAKKQTRYPKRATR